MYALVSLTYTAKADLSPCLPPTTLRDPFAWKDIIKRVASKYGLTVAEITGNSRARRISWPRFELMAALHRDLGWSLPAVGRRVGDKDHTTVLHGINRFKTQEVQDYLASLSVALAAE